MRRLTLALLTLSLLAGCGGSDQTFTEVAPPPATTRLQVNMVFNPPLLNQTVQFTVDVKAATTEQVYTALNLTRTPPDAANQAVIIDNLPQGPARLRVTAHNVTGAFMGANEQNLTLGPNTNFANVDQVTPDPR